MKKMIFIFLFLPILCWGQKINLSIGTGASINTLPGSATKANSSLFIYESGKLNPVFQARLSVYGNGRLYIAGTIRYLSTSAKLKLLYFGLENDGKLSTSVVQFLPEIGIHLLSVGKMGLNAGLQAGASLHKAGNSSITILPYNSSSSSKIAFATGVNLTLSYSISYRIGVYVGTNPVYDYFKSPDSFDHNSTESNNQSVISFPTTIGLSFKF